MCRGNRKGGAPYLGSGMPGKVFGRKETVLLLYPVVLVRRGCIPISQVGGNNDGEGAEVRETSRKFT